MKWNSTTDLMLTTTSKQTQELRTGLDIKTRTINEEVTTYYPCRLNVSK